ncbi:MAG: cupin domain-containing protein [Nocardioidaceae bacterium]|jgi:transcriptional regulator with XRE-family HTH domain|nr:cupin domain-containing protein [Nocardioidaceae bacterium]
MKEQLGMRLRAIRMEQGLTLRALAARADISPSMLSQVETGKIHPSVTTLYSLVSLLGVSLDKLLELTPTENAQEPARAADVVEVQRRDDRDTIEMENGVVWERLATAGEGGVDPLLVTYLPGASGSVEGKLVGHRGTEFGFVLEGELTLLFDRETWTLRPGDSVSFDSRRPHLYRNDTHVPVRGLWFVVGRDEDMEAPSTEAPVTRGTNRFRSAADAQDTADRLPPA